MSQSDSRRLKREYLRVESDLITRILVDIGIGLFFLPIQGPMNPRSEDQILRCVSAGGRGPAGTKTGLAEHCEARWAIWNDAVLASCAKDWLTPISRSLFANRPDKVGRTRFGCTGSP